MAPNTSTNADQLSTSSRSSRYETFKKYLRSKRHRDSPSTTLREQIRNSRLLAKTRSHLPAWRQPFPEYDVDECFVPCPKVTFLVDKPGPLLCQICRASHLKLRSGSKPAGDDTFAILPCGHVAGSVCLKKWCDHHHECPFCRLKLKYPGCGHPIEPKSITNSRIYILPRTLPDKGELPRKCEQCYRQNLQQVAEESFAAAVSDFEIKRRRAHVTGKREDERDLEIARETMENVVRQELHEKYSLHRVTMW